MTMYSHDEIDTVVRLASDNPRGFLQLVNKYCKDVTVDEVKKSMTAWGIDPTTGRTVGSTPKNGKSSSNRTTRRRQNNRNQEFPHG